LFYKGNIINPNIQLELPVSLKTYRGSIYNDFDYIIEKLSYHYPSLYDCDIYLKRRYDYEIIQKCQELIKYVKSHSKEAEAFLHHRYNNYYKYEIDSHNLPILDYAEFVEYTYNFLGKDGGREAAKKMLARYDSSWWFSSYTPNVFIDVVKLRKFAEKYNLLLYFYIDEIDDEEYLTEHGKNYFIPESVINQYVLHKENFNKEELIKLVPVLKKLIPFLKKSLPEIIKQIKK
jgi:hypothetical protein